MAVQIERKHTVPRYPAHLREELDYGAVAEVMQK
jgi:hypothetical protein